MENWIPESDRRSCISYYGNMAQVAGLRRCILSDGKAAGVEAVDVNTGGGLEFTVLPGRGMDVAGCRYRGVPVSYISKAGITAPSYHDARQSQWLKSFFAGMLTTCGISNAGPDCTDIHPVLGEVLYGLHGDISNTAADQVGTWEDWTPEGYQMRVTGRMSEGRLHGEHLTLRRTIETGLGEKCFRIRDAYQNVGSTPDPLMFFYHINIGYPILDKGSRFIAPSDHVWAETEVSKKGMGRYEICDRPREGVTEQQFFHEFHTDKEGRTTVALVNNKLKLAFYLTFYPAQMPCFAQWKVGREGEYVFAFEPGNCHPIGRKEQRQRGKLEVLEPMQTHLVEMELGILDGEEEIQKLRKRIEHMMLSEGCK